MTVCEDDMLNIAMPIPVRSLLPYMYGRTERIT